uniref:Uncharacterized protein n=1 Tax=Arundo donax TaxID=35708 RepID=A0A0A9E771_ARUDO
MSRPANGLPVSSANENFDNGNPGNLAVVPSRGRCIKAGSPGTEAQWCTYTKRCQHLHPCLHNAPRPQVMGP